MKIRMEEAISTRNEYQKKMEEVMREKRKLEVENSALKGENKVKKKKANQSIFISLFFLGSTVDLEAVSQARSGSSDGRAVAASRKCGEM
jgi:hypothetical protein